MPIVNVDWARTCRSSQPDLVNIYGCRIGDETGSGPSSRFRRASHRRAVQDFSPTPSSAKASRSRTKSSSATA